MSSSFSVGGLASGLDTDAIVEALVNVKQAQLISPLEDKVIELSSKQSALDTVNTAMESMLSATKSIQNITDFEGKAATSSNTDVLTVSNLLASASKGTYSVNITALAQADRNYFTGVASTSSTTATTGTVTITSSGITTSIVIDSTNNTLTGIRDAINASTAPVTATIVNDGSGATPYRLVLTSDNTGADADITQDIAAITGLTDDAALNANALNTAQDAALTVNGMAVTATSNVVTNGIPGLTMNLVTTHTDVANPIRVTINGDYTGAETAISNLLNSYNEVIAKLKDQFAVDSTTGRSTGTLASDITLQSIQYRLHNLILSPQTQLAGNDYQTLAEIGVSMDDDGYLVINAAELEEALSIDEESVQRLFQGMSSTVGGISDTVYDYLYDMTNDGDGIMTQKARIWQESIDDALDQIDEYNDRIDAYEAQLKAKFAYMEQVISSLQLQSSALTASQASLESIAKQRNS